MLQLRTQALIAALAGACAEAASATAQGGAALQAQHAALQEQLEHNQFQRPLYLESSEMSGAVKGEVYAVISQSYAVVAPTLRNLANWCGILMLHQNVKGCRSDAAPGRETLRLSMGRKFDQPLDEAYPFSFEYKVAADGADYLRVLMDARQGPLGTSRYRIALEIVPLDTQHSFLHLSYSYAYGMTARVATGIYLATVGRNKVGFSVAGLNADGQPVHIGGTRGVVERNAMRCYLAIEAYLAALSAPPDQQDERRLNNWYLGIERYPVQLHEMQRSEYLDMKRREYHRQRMADSVVPAK